MQSLYKTTFLIIFLLTVLVAPTHAQLESAIHAIPEIRNEDPENLIYTWYVNSESQVRGVLGEQTFSFLVTKNVTFIPVMVEVSNLSQSVTVRKGISIPIIRPPLTLYQKQDQ